MCTKFGVRAMAMLTALGAGIPSLFIYRVEDPNYHTAGDRPELVDPASLEQAGSIALRVLDSLAADPSPAQ